MEVHPNGIPEFHQKEVDRTTDLIMMVRDSDVNLFSSRIKLTTVVVVANHRQWLNLS